MQQGEKMSEGLVRFFHIFRFTSHVSRALEAL